MKKIYHFKGDALQPEMEVTGFLWHKHPISALWFIR